MQNESLISSYFSFIDDTYIYMVMPLMDYGDLGSVLALKYPTGITDEVAISTIMRDCLKAIDCLNNHNMFHRDIKASNILFDSDGSCKLGDYGVSTAIKKGGNNSYVGSLCYMAPEMTISEKYDFKVDIWSLGITALEIADGKPPFFRLSPFDLAKQLVEGNVPELIDRTHKWSQEFKDMVKSCLVKNPKERPTAKEVLEKNAVFFSKAKDRKYILETVLKGIPRIQERYPLLNPCDGSGRKNGANAREVNWDFGDNNSNKKASQSNTVSQNIKSIKNMFADLNEDDI